MLANWHTSMMVQQVEEEDADWQRKIGGIAIAYGLSYAEAERIFTKYVQHSSWWWRDCYFHIIYNLPDLLVSTDEECKTLQIP